MELKILKGDNLQLLKDYQDNYFDSVVTDCPYGLSSEPDPIKLLQDWIDHGYHEIKAKGGFMGKKWDNFVPQPILWKEVFRVLKPGGHLLAFFGTRTYDWGTIAIRLAGFEVRDTMSWLYGSGFPKSLDISKAIDKKNGSERQSTGRVKSVTGKRLTETIDDKNGRSGKNNRVFSNTVKFENVETVAASEEAKQWEGWGTALKPAQELICMARKPIEKTVSHNILKHSTGGINIDGCRIQFESEDDLKSAIFGRGTDINGGNFVGSEKSNGKINVEANPNGRFPSNLILDDHAAGILDLQTGLLTSGKPSGLKKGNNNNVYGQYEGGIDVTGYGDSGGASRFFYCAKAGQDERNLGCEALAKSKGGMISNTSGQHMTRRDPEYQSPQVANGHPTVKPIALMRYLLRLVTPPGGKTADIFAGSGTTGCAAYFEDIGEIVLMELDDEGTYIPIIEARTAYWSKENNRRNYLEEIKLKPVEVPPNQTSLF